MNYLKWNMHINRRYIYILTIWFTSSFHLRPLWSAALLVLTTAACVFPAYWATGLLGTYRTLNVAYFFFLPLWFVNLTVWLNHPWGVTLRTFALSRHMTAVLLAIALLDMSFNKHGYDACMDLLQGRAQRFDAAMIDRYARFTSGTDVITFSDVVDPPRTLCMYRQSGDDRRWMNDCEARYFGVEGDRVKVMPVASP